MKLSGCFSHSRLHYESTILIFGIIEYGRKKIKVIDNESSLYQIIVVAQEGNKEPSIIC